MHVGILGSGDVAKSLGRGFVQTGHAVKLGSRTPKSESLVAWAQRIGAGASIGTLEEVAMWGELLVLATRGVENASAVGLAGPAHFAGKVVIDVTNPLVFGPAPPPALLVGHTDSAGEQLQRLLPEARVVKAFNTTGNSNFFHPKFPGGPPDMFFCGNDPAAKATVAEILTTWGWNPVDIGGIEGARVLEPMCLLWVTAAMRLGSWDIAFKVLRK
jgi:8-hydroxy-5-deazaflavin:NADPH oxidoreductase